MLLDLSAEQRDHVNRRIRAEGLADRVQVDLMDYRDIATHVDGDDEHDDQVRNALLKGLAAVVIIGLVIAIGTVLVVRALGLDDDSAAGPVGPVAAWRGTPSAYPAGTSASVVGGGATQVWP